ncbi:uncharacterized protein LOC132582946 [Heteronotia binoei]|uniref:uncharacterized protein LOC132582946 n=1 Tax=Heteronotia binoei TaxID=13085 RepID=UPI00292E1A16|nr:uncharacterized protein LOC132582946 [Heteronotia binoei]
MGQRAVRWSGARPSSAEFGGLRLWGGDPAKAGHEHGDSCEPPERDDCGGFCDSFVVLTAKGESPPNIGTQQPRAVRPEAWELGVGEPAELKGRRGEGVRAGGVSSSRSFGGISSHDGPKRDPVRGAAVWVHKEWCRGPVEASGQVWVPRKPGRASQGVGLTWSQGGAGHPRRTGGWEAESRGVGSNSDLSQVWIPREKPAGAGGGPGDVWVHKVRNPSGAGIMWVWAKVTNCNEEEVEEARVWTFRKDSPRKGGQGEGGYGVS